MVEREKCKQLAGLSFNKRHIGINLLCLIETQNMVGYGLGIIKEDTAVAGRAGGAQCDLLAPSFLSRFATCKHIGCVNEFERASFHGSCRNIARRTRLGHYAV